MPSGGKNAGCVLDVKESACIERSSGQRGMTDNQIVLNTGTAAARFVAVTEPDSEAAKRRMIDDFKAKESPVQVAEEVAYRYYIPCHKVSESSARPTVFHAPFKD